MLVKWFRSCNWRLLYCMKTFTKNKDISDHKFNGIWDKMCYILCMWLAFICILLLLHSLWHAIYFNYSNILRCNQVALSRQRWLISSCAQQTPWCKLQGTVDGHIPLPRRQCQQVCQRQPMVRLNHPIIKRTCSKIHNYTSPLTRHKEFIFIGD